MPRPRFAKLPPERRDAILDAAAREFAEHGFDGASLNHILAAAGVSKGAAYYYFDDKADLFATVALHFWEHVLGHVDVELGHLTARSFWPTIDELFRQQMEHLQERPWLAGLGRAMWKLPPGQRTSGPLGAMMARVAVWVQALLRRGQELGQVRTDLPLDLLMSLALAVDEAADHWVADHLDGDAATALRALGGDHFRRLLAPRRQTS